MHKIVLYKEKNREEVVANKERICVVQKAGLAGIIARGDNEPNPRCKYVARVLLPVGFQFEGIRYNKELKLKEEGLRFKKKGQKVKRKGLRIVKESPDIILEEGTIPHAFLPLLMDLVEGLVMRGEDFLVLYTSPNKAEYMLRWRRVGKKEEDPAFRQYVIDQAQAQARKEEREKEEREKNRRLENLARAKKIGVATILMTSEELKALPPPEEDPEPPLEEGDWNWLPQ